MRIRPVLCCIRALGVDSRGLRKGQRGRWTALGRLQTLPGPRRVFQSGRHLSFGRRRLLQRGLPSAQRVRRCLQRSLPESSRRRLATACVVWISGVSCCKRCNARSCCKAGLKKEVPGEWRSGSANASGATRAVLKNFSEAPATPAHPSPSPRTRPRRRSRRAVLRDPPGLLGRLGWRWGCFRRRGSRPAAHPRRRGCRSSPDGPVFHSPSRGVAGFRGGRRRGTALRRGSEQPIVSGGWRKDGRTVTCPRTPAAGHLWIRAFQEKVRPRKEQRMKKETPKKLSLNVETLKDLDLAQVAGGEGTPLPASAGSRIC